MAAHPSLGAVAQVLVEKAIDDLFDRLKARFLGPGAEKAYGKQLRFRFPAALSLTGLYETAGNLEGVQPREEVLSALLRTAGSYVDAQREHTKARVMQRVQSFLTDAHQAGVRTDVKTVLGGEMSRVWKDVSTDIKKIVETETTITRNTSIFDAIGRIGAATGHDDPVVFFVVVRDKSLCEECQRLHLLSDETTPRVWLYSELGGGYHKRGEENPKVGGLHPHCRCVLTHLMKGYGFDAAGRIMYRGPDWDELAHQRD